jgi:dTDP-4-dehydrorhamnose 3,5-epimerase
MAERSELHHGLHVVRGEIEGVLILKPPRFEDERGYFSEAFSVNWLRSLNLDVEFVQDNHSFSTLAGTVRGFHFQAPPAAQAKLVSVVAGAVMDVVLDLRAGSPTFGRWQSVEVSAREGNQVLVPTGCAHAFCTLEDGTHLLYKVSAPYAPDTEGGVLWDDTDLGVEWPPMDRYVLSERDLALPRLRDLQSPFVFAPVAEEAEVP